MSSPTVRAGVSYTVRVPQVTSAQAIDSPVCDQADQNARNGDLVGLGVERTGIRFKETEDFFLGWLVALFGLVLFCFLFRSDFFLYFCFVLFFCIDILFILIFFLISFFFFFFFFGGGGVRMMPI